jgi:selenocysteine lyase/cysteine desulfurase
VIAPAPLVSGALDDVCHEVIGRDVLVPTTSGRLVRYVNVDNAATTPPMRSVLDAIEAVLPVYASVHRGSGHNARVCTARYEQARCAVGRFVGADPDRDVVIFTKNTTEAINKLAGSAEFGDDAVVLTTVAEHHSNDLPWRSRARTIHVGALADGTIDLDDLDRHLSRHAGRVALLAVTGTSNVTGVVPPIHDMASRVHAVGGRILVDAAQLAAHRPIDMGPHHDAEHLDFVALSAHKMYAPFGSGALVGRRDGFGGEPAHRGGGTVDAVTLDDVAWAGLPDREEAGTPNLIGAVAFEAAVQAFDRLGWRRIVAHERALLDHALTELSSLPEVRIHGPSSTSAIDSKVAVIPFTVDGMDHGHVAAALGYEHGIGVRSGCFCAHPYVAHLLGMSRESARMWANRVRNGDKQGAPGMVRISLGIGNDLSDVDRVMTALTAIVSGDIAADYQCDGHGEYHPTTTPG